MAHCPISDKEKRRKEKRISNFTTKEMYLNVQVFLKACSIFDKYFELSVRTQGKHFKLPY